MKRFLFIIALASAAFFLSGPDAEARYRRSCRRGRCCVRACAKPCCQPTSGRCCVAKKACPSGVPAGETYRAVLPMAPAPAWAERAAEYGEAAPAPAAGEAAPMPVAPKLEIDIHKPGGAK